MTEGLATVGGNDEEPLDRGSYQRPDSVTKRERENMNFDELV